MLANNCYIIFNWSNSTLEMYLMEYGSPVPHIFVPTVAPLRANFIKHVVQWASLTFDHVLSSHLQPLTNVPKGSSHIKKR